MRDESIARNYSEALLALARKENAATEWASLINAVAAAIEGDLTLTRFLAAPQVSADDKIAVLGKALKDKAPKLFVKFLQKLAQQRVAPVENYPAMLHKTLEAVAPTSSANEPVIVVLTPRYPQLGIF